jgi:hypothetical protein
MDVVLDAADSEGGAILIPARAVKITMEFLAKRKSLSQGVRFLVE